MAPHVIIKSAQMSAQDREALCLKLSSEAWHATMARAGTDAQPERSGLIKQLINSARLFVEEKGLDLRPCSDSPRPQRSPKHSPKARKSRRQNKVLPE